MNFVNTGITPITVKKLCSFQGQTFMITSLILIQQKMNEGNSSERKTNFVEAQAFSKMLEFNLTLCHLSIDKTTPALLFSSFVISRNKENSCAESFFQI